MLEMQLYGIFMVLLVRLIDLDKEFWFEYRFCCSLFYFCNAIMLFCFYLVSDSLFSVGLWVRL